MKRILENLKSFIDQKKYFFYIIPLIIYINITLIDTTTTFFNESLMTYKSLIKYLCIGVIIIKILICDMKNYRKNNYIRLIIILIIFSLSSLFSKNRAIIQYFFIILGSYNLDFKKILKYVLIGEGICVLTIIILSVLNVISNRVFGRNNSEVQRYSLGFQYATYPALFVWYLTMLYIYLRGKKTKIYEYIILLLLSIILYRVTNSRNELLFSICAIGIAIVYNKFNIPKLKALVNCMGKYSIIFFSLLSILLMNMYDPGDSKWKKIDSFVSGRLKYSYICKKNYEVKLFGNEMEWIGLSDIYEGKYKESEFFFVDNSYLNILYNYGIIFLILVNFAYFYLINKLSKEKEDFLILVLLLIIMHSFIDPQLVKIIYNIFILQFVNLIFDNEKLFNFSKRKKVLNEQNI